MSVRLLPGDCRAILPTLAEGSVHCVVTSPPYWGLRDYGVAGQLGLEPTPEEYVAQMIAVFREVRRVLRADGTLWMNMGENYASSLGGIGNNPSPKSTLTTNNGRGPKPGDKYAPGHEGNAVPLKHGLKPKDLVGMPWRLAFALQADGWYLRADIIWAKPNPMPESVTDRPTKAHEYVFLLSKSARYFYDADAVREPDAGAASGNGFAGRQGQARQTTISGGTGSADRFIPGTGRNLRSVWTIPSAPFPDAHFATFPPALAQRCILAGSRMGDTVLDPFGGSGTVGMVAEQLGRHSILIELSPAYMRMAEERTAQLGLFAQDAAPA